MSQADSSLHLYIDGEWLAGNGRKTQPVVNPATGEPVGTLPHAGTADLDRALAAAARAYHGWRKTPALERARILKRAAELIRERAADIARRLTLEQGKPLAEATAEVGGAADIFEWNAEEARRIYGRLVPARGAGQRLMVTHEPVGPVAAFAPWNFPVLLPARKISAALAAGCSCIIKPAEETPSATLALARALEDAGLPKGVLNVVFGVPGEISAYLLASPVIRKISFTGSTAVGKQLQKLAADGLKRCTMELGGHAPVVVFPDADPDQAAAASAVAKFRNAGQVCVSPTRFYVHEDIHDRFVQRLVEAARALKLGDGLVPDVGMGPCANPRRLDAMAELIGDAQKNGAKLAAGGRRSGNKGYFWEPTVLTDVPRQARIMNEEPFGPVATVNRFRAFDEVVAEANRLPFGLAAFAFTQSASTAASIGEALEAGMVGINSFAISLAEMPFGGIKESGYGSEGGSESLDSYLVTKTISHQV
jgi:succinate-semialdehyde dehydrogenase/glutarate-semialdehyde dehydrogenase